MNKEALKVKQQEILDLIKPFCAEKLNEEYYQLSEKIVQKLGRKRNPIFESGQVKIWAVAVIHALGTVNFLFDKNTEPFVSVRDINDYFGTNMTTTGMRSKEIRDLLKLRQWDKEFSTNAIRERNPFANWVTYNGFIVPIDALPEPYQQMARQAKALGKEIAFGRV